MKRRAALAASLCLTTIVGFAIVVFGRQDGLFGAGDSSGGEAQAVAVVATDVPPPAPTDVPQPTPIIIEQYVYRDEYVQDLPAAQAPSGGTTSARTLSSAQPAPTTGAAAPAPTAPAAPTPEGSAPPGSGSDQTSARVPSEFSGDVIALSGSEMTVLALGGQYRVALSAQTSVHGGRLSVGVSVQVHAQTLSDGSAVATEVEVASGESDD